ncbi:MAG: lysylphosphatidylglycerol synthase transmembrane domain-containing protein [Candidatus Woesearchaeota archaeon]
MSSTQPDSSLSTGRDAIAVPRWLARVGKMSWFVALPAIAAFVIREVIAGKLGGAASDLSRASLGWIGAAVALEVTSYLLYAAGQRRLLGRSARHIGIGWLASLDVCAQGVSNFVPAGYVAANLLNFRELRRRGLSSRSTAGLLVWSSGLYIGSLSFLTVIAGEVAGGRAGGSLEGARVAASVVLAGLPLFGLAAWLLLRHGVIRPPAAWRMSGERLRVPRSAAAFTAVLFTASWLADAGCLVAAIHAVGAHPEWTLVPIAYCAAQLVSFLPVTPGGLGLVEGSLTVALMAGGGGAPVLAAVLLYRMISYWGTLPFGLLGYLGVRRARIAGSSNPDGHREPAPALGDRASGGDRPVLVFEG